MKKLFVIFAMLMLTLCSSAEGSYWHAKYYAYRKYNTGWSPWSRWIPCDIYIFTGNGGFVVYGDGWGDQYNKYTQVYHGIAKTSEYYDNANNFTIHIQAMDLKNEALYYNNADKCQKENP